LGHDPESQARRLAGLQAAREAGAHYKRAFQDAGYWDELARGVGLRLPQWHQGPEPKLMRRWLEKLAIPTEAYLKWAGERSLSDFARRNPEWGLRPWVGLLLEARATGAFDAVGDEESAEAAAALDKLGDG
jgi:hypothetical protein